MKLLVLLFAVVVFCNAAPAPEPDPAPKPVPAPAPKPNPGLLLPVNPSPTIITSPVVSYSHYYKSPLYPPYSPYIYNLGYAPTYSYNTYPYVIHYI